MRTASLTSEKQGGIKTRSPSALLLFKAHNFKMDTDKSEKEAKSQATVSFCLREKPEEAEETKTDLKPLRSSVENQQNFLACVF